MVETVIQRFSTLFIFKKITDMPLLNFKIHGTNFEKNLKRSAHNGWAPKKIVL